MEKERWEYCMLSGAYSGIYDYPKLIFFTVEGEKVESLSGGSESSDNDKVARRIAELGGDGWEMIGVYGTTKGGVIYFERKVT